MVLRDRIDTKVERLYETRTACVLECVKFRNCVLSRVLLSLAAGSIPAASICRGVSDNRRHPLTFFVPMSQKSLMLLEFRR
jgi:hypothetical protein